MVGTIEEIYRDLTEQIFLIRINSSSNFSIFHSSGKSNSFHLDQFLCLSQPMHFTYLKHNCVL